MNKQKMTIEDLALIVNNLTLEMRAGFKTVNDRLDNLEKDMAIIKREASKHGWDLNPDKK